MTAIMTRSKTKISEHRQEFEKFQLIIDQRRITLH